MSIQRLGGLKLPPSRDALHRTMKMGDKNEANWAVYAALRTSDIAVLPTVKQMLSGGDKSSPEQEIALKLRYVNDSNAAPDLIAILASATGELTQSSVLFTLAENIKDPRAAPILADHLSSTDESTQYLALDGLRNITREQACSPSEGSNTQNLEWRVRQCKLWWQEKGKLQSWDKY